jgi:hypothetical protein
MEFQDENYLPSRKLSPERKIKKNPLDMPLLTISGNKGFSIAKTQALPFIIIKEAWTFSNHDLIEEAKKHQKSFHSPMLNIRTRKDRTKTYFVPILTKTCNSNFKNLTV